MLRSNSKSLRNHEVSPEEETERLHAVGRICRKGRFQVWNERENEILLLINNNKYEC